MLISLAITNLLSHRAKNERTIRTEKPIWLAEEFHPSEGSPVVVGNTLYESMDPSGSIGTFDHHFDYNDEEESLAIARDICIARVRPLCSPAGGTAVDPSH